MVLPLNQIKAGEEAQVAFLAGDDSISLRLYDLGFVPGGAVTALQESPWGDPVAYAVCGAVIALRRADARGIGIYPA